MPHGSLGKQEQGALHDVFDRGSLALAAAIVQRDHVAHTHSSSPAILGLQPACVLSLEVCCPACAHFRLVWRPL